jgi:phosphoglucomutase
MDLLQNYLKFEPIESFKEILLKETDSKKIQSNYFNQLITFGTAGLRGVMKPGISGINGYTIAQAASACGLYLKKLHPHKTLTVCISYDNRHHSMQFAEVTARVLAKMGILVKLSRTLFGAILGMSFFMSFVSLEAAIFWGQVTFCKTDT